MSTSPNYTFQSFNFRSRAGARPFYDLLCRIATEEFGHVELVSTTVNTMLREPHRSTTARHPAHPWPT
jgi:Mn-containing catalase